MKNLLDAFRLLTSLPVPDRGEWRAGDSGRAAGWFPFIGLCLGTLVALVFHLLGLFAPPLVAAALALAMWVALTGGLHLDGLSDCCDGMFHAAAPERRLQIMKDPHIGVFGAIGLVLILLVKFALLASIAPGRAAGAILLAASLARWCAVLAGMQPPASSIGMGADFSAGLEKSAIALGALIPCTLVFWMNAAGFIALGAGLLTTIAFGRLAKINLGGITGDVLGAVVEIVEAVVLLACMVAP